MIRLVPLAAALSLTTIALPAAAQSFHAHTIYSQDPYQIVRQTKFDYSDLDLSRSQDAQTLLTRIEGAADAVCRDRLSDDSRSSRTNYKECRRQAIALAVRTVHSPVLRQLAQSRRDPQVAAR